MLVVLPMLFLAAIVLCGYACLDAVDRSGGCDEADRLALSFPVGLAIVGAALYSLNVIGAPFGRPLVLVTLAAGSVMGAARLRSRRWTPAGALSPLRDLPSSGGPLGLISVIVVLFVVAGFAALCLMHVNLQGDTRSQHFSYPAILLRTGWQPAYATLSGGESFNVTPALLVTYAAYWSAIGRIEQIGPNLLPLLLLVPWGLLGLVVLRRIFGSRAPASFVLLLFVALYESNSLICGENQDLLPTILAAGAAYLLARDIREGTSIRIAPAISLLGLCCWSKLHGIPVSVCLALAFVLAAKGSVRSRLKTGSWIVVGPLLWLAPYLIRNALVFGNPLYPVGCRWLGGFLATPWILHVVVTRWQPAHPFYAFPTMLTLCLRDPALVFGAPAAWLAIRHRRRAEAFLGVAAGLYLCVFLAVLTNRTPSPLRFAAPALALLCWHGAAFLGRLAEPASSAGSDRPCRSDDVRAFFGWSLATSLLIAVCVLVWIPAISSADDTLWRHPVASWDTFYKFWWILPVAAVVRLSSVERFRRAAPLLPAAVAVLGLAVVAIRTNQPFVEVTQDSRIGLLTAPDWSLDAIHSPVLRWLGNKDDSGATCYSYLEERWDTPAAIVSAEDALCEPLHHPGVSDTVVLECLRRLGVRHVLQWQGYQLLSESPVYRTDRVFQLLSSPSCFTMEYRDLSGAFYLPRYAAGETPAVPTATHPMPWLMDFAADSSFIAAGRHPAHGRRGPAPPV